MNLHRETSKNGKANKEMKNEVNSLRIELEKAENKNKDKV
jgi:hypothetical protein